MNYLLKAACGCDAGKRRSNNEDNFLFDRHSLSWDSLGLPQVLSAKYTQNADTVRCFAVFDGVGGEANGEIASAVAAAALKEYLSDCRGLKSQPEDFLRAACTAMNDAVCQETVRRRCRCMGTTAALLVFQNGNVHICNIGDSRIYLLRDRKLTQLSIDHVEKLPAHFSHHKPGLTQYIGIFPDELTLDPYISHSSLHKDDIYLICSDGLTDMLTDTEISDCLQTHISERQCVQHLITSALRNGGKDNVTALVIRVK